MRTRCLYFEINGIQFFLEFENTITSLTHPTIFGEVFWSHLTSDFLWEKLTERPQSHLSPIFCVKKKSLPSPFCAKSYCFPLCWRVKVLGVTKPEAFPQIPVSAIEGFGSILTRLINSHQIIFHISIPSNSKLLFEKSLMFLSFFLFLWKLLASPLLFYVYFFLLIKFYFIL